MSLQCSLDTDVSGANDEKARNSHQLHHHGDVRQLGAPPACEAGVSRFDPGTSHCIIQQNALVSSILDLVQGRFYRKTRKDSILKTIITIHHHNKFGRTGFESSQQTRMRLAQLNHFDYLHLITSPQPNNFKELFKDIGFDYGSIETLDQALMGTSATKIDQNHYQYTQNGNIVGEARYDENCTMAPVPMWIYSKDDILFTEESLIVWYLSKHIKDAVIFRDESRIPMPQLVRFTKSLDIPYFEIIHHNVLNNGYLPILSKKVNYIVANERLTQELIDKGFNAQFLPPLCIQNHDIKIRTVPSVQKYVWSAHLGDYKNFAQALRVMNKLIDTPITLDVYGGSQEDFDKHCEINGGVPPNVHYKGFVAKVPYEQYDGFLSTSRNELFANACIEALSTGLKCVVSNLKYPFKDYTTESRGEISLAYTDDEFEQCLRNAQNKVFHTNHQIDLLKKYTYERWTPRFSKLCLPRKDFN